MSYLTEENLRSLLHQYRSLGLLPGVFLTFMKSFVPPLPTMIIVGVNAAVYGFWLGFLSSWIGLVSGCAVTFLLVRKAAGHPYLEKWASKPKVQKGMVWVRRNAFSYVFLLSISPVGPFVVVNVAAGLSRMSVRSYLLAVALGKGIMVLMVSYIGYDLARFAREPYRLLYVVLFIGLCLIIMRRLEARFTRSEANAAE
ncbi:TVP38/TMEM64 family protein [Paenibacillus sp. GCM10023252]|uniref:TVP38/TMEM64 family protein n=1 Tax=Paenibacillus sp. GCM10023252 TaxID=3252649 RepID=UPI003608BC48